jgi:hypothetical protein
MSEFDPIGDAFADFSAKAVPMIKPTGLGPIRATVSRRRGVRVTVAAVLTALAIAVPVTGYAMFPSRSGDAPSPTADPSSSTSSPTVTQAKLCTGTRLSAEVTGQGSMASQPWAVIALTNTSGSPCELNGYPRLAATGYPGNGPAAIGPLNIDVRNGSIMERTDPGPGRITLAPHATASFAIGTGTAYDTLYTVAQVRVMVSGDQTGVLVTVNMSASAPTGAPIPIGVTALVAGRDGPA